MNEKIRELAEQAKITFTDYGSGEFLTEDDISLPRLEKFAELIVRECRDIVEQDMKLAHIQMIPFTLEKYANGRLKEKIKKHFGVEE
jgi:hypothetical protein